MIEAAEIGIVGTRYDVRSGSPEFLDETIAGMSAGDVKAAVNADWPADTPTECCS